MVSLLNSKRIKKFKLIIEFIITDKTNNRIINYKIDTLLPVLSLFLKKELFSHWVPRKIINTFWKTNTLLTTLRI